MVPNAMTISRWLKKAAPAPAVLEIAPPPAPAPALPSSTLPLPAHMSAPEAPKHEAVNVDDPIALVKQLIREQHAQIHADRASGARGTSVSSAVATLEKLTKTLKQLEESDRKAGDGITISSTELARIEASLDERIKANCARGELRCAKCSRELSVLWGTGLTELELDAASKTDMPSGQKAPSQG